MAHTPLPPHCGGSILFCMFAGKVRILPLGRNGFMEQKQRLPRDVVGEDPLLLDYWPRMHPMARRRLLESNISVSTLGELKKLDEELR